MNNISGAVELNVVIGALLILLLLLYLISRETKKMKVKKEFEQFRDNVDFPQQDMRTVPRITVPDSLEIIVTLPDGLKGYIVKMSLSSFDMRPSFSLKKPLINSLYSNVAVHTPINRFMIKEAKIIRSRRRDEKRLVALRIVKMEDDQFDYLKNFMAFLDKFGKNDY